MAAATAAAPVAQQRGAELFAALALSLVSLALWGGTFQLESTSPAPTGRGAGGRSPGQEGAALVNRMLEDDVAQCVRLEIDPVCRALTRADPVHCLGEEECLAEVRLLTALKGKGSCSSIQGATGNLMCIAVSTRDEAKCSTLAQPIRTECLAVVQNAPAQCDNLKKEERANCRNTWAMVRSLLQNDAKLCAHLPDYDPEKKSPHSMRRFCLAVAAMAPSRCEMDLKNYCRRRISLKHLTRHSCHVLQNALLRQRCKEIHGR